MYKLSNSILLSIFILSAGLLAQEEESHMGMAPPPPVEDDFFKWMEGEWKGYSESEMGKSNDHMTMKMDLGGQFLITTYKSELDNGMVMTGMGAITHSYDGKLAGYWIDSFRTMSEGKGSREGNISKMEWTTPMGVYVRTTEKIDENIMKITGLMTASDGKKMSSKAEYKRVK